MRRLYGASPWHLAAHLALLPLAGWAIVQILGQHTAVRILVWLAAAAIVHDFVLLPAYSALDRVVVRRRAVNHVRVPAALSLLLGLVFYPVITGHGEAAFHRVSGLTWDGYAARWLIATAVLFSVSEALYLVRGLAAGRRRRP